MRARELVIDYFDPAEHSRRRDTAFRLWAGVHPDRKKEGFFALFDDIPDDQTQQGILGYDGNRAAGMAIVRTGIGKWMKTPEAGRIAHLDHFAVDTSYIYRGSWERDFLRGVEDTARSAGQMLIEATTRNGDQTALYLSTGWQLEGNPGMPDRGARLSKQLIPASPG